MKYDTFVKLSRDELDVVWRALYEGHKASVAESKRDLAEYRRCAKLAETIPSMRKSALFWRSAIARDMEMARIMASLRRRLLRRWPRRIPVDGDGCPAV